MEGIEFQLHNTMTKQKEPFRPRDPGKVGMYVCGVTAYDLSHIGHARVYVAFDVLYRYLKHLGYEVNYVRNFTDVDDKIIRRANELGEEPISLSARFCEEFLLDMADLQCLPPTVQPRVSDHMPQIIEMIQKIIDNGCAYVLEGDVYFSVDNSPDYGRLSGRKLEDNRAGERVAVDERKRNPADFALWKSAKPGEPTWDSPWGPGRPGWHIECSAMSSYYLGHAFDIHGGGMDLIFPHHENEIAQSCAACPESNVNYWVHNGFVTENKEKMSKSLGNFFTIRTVTARYHPLALRLFLMDTHYRSPVNYSEAQLESASDRLFYIYQTLHDCEATLSQFRDKPPNGRITPDTKNCIDKFKKDVESSMANDLHTNDVLKDLWDPLKAMNALNSGKGGQKQQASRILSLIALDKEVKDVLTILGLVSTSPSEVLQQLRELALKRAQLTEEQLLQRVEERAAARKNKEYEKSDKIRNELAKLGIGLMDNDPRGRIWIPIVPPEKEAAAA
ncbi:unnamed protein product [Victoria cruziana]